MRYQLCLGRHGFARSMYPGELVVGHVEPLELPVLDG